MNTILHTLVSLTLISSSMHAMEDGKYRKPSTNPNEVVQTIAVSPKKLAVIPPHSKTPPPMPNSKNIETPAESAKQILEPVVQYQRGIIASAFSWAIDRTTVHGVIYTLQSNDAIDTADIVDTQHKVEWAINELIRRILEEEKRNNLSSIAGLQATMNNNKQQIENLNTILELSNKKIQITETILTNAYATLCRHSENMQRFCYLITSFINSQIRDCKRGRLLIRDLKLSTNNVGDIGDISDDEYDANLDDLQSKVKNIFIKESKKN